MAIKKRYEEEVTAVAEAPKTKKELDAIPKR